jgi:hypothetical protein
MSDIREARKVLVTRILEGRRGVALSTVDAIADFRGGSVAPRAIVACAAGTKVAPLPSMQPALRRTAGSRFAAIASNYDCVELEVDLRELLDHAPEPLGVPSELLRPELSGLAVLRADGVDRGSRRGGGLLFDLAAATSERPPSDGSPTRRNGRASLVARVGPDRGEERSWPAYQCIVDEGEIGFGWGRPKGRRCVDTGDALVSPPRAVVMRAPSLRWAPVLPAA